MGDKTGIEWTDATWNPVTGCTKVSQGCKHCYAKHQAWPRLKASKGTVYFGREFEDVQWHADRLAQPLRWAKPRRIFVNSMSDVFHEAVPDAFLDGMFAVMALAPRHTFQVLTKRAQRMREYLGREGLGNRVLGVAWEMLGHMPKYVHGDVTRRSWPLPNVWLGVSVEDQATADERIPLLLRTPAAVRWISAEPLLGAIDLRAHLEGHCTLHDFPGGFCVQRDHPEVQRLGWVVVGGESGPGARPMHPQWAIELRDQCVDADVPFLFKQWGEWAPILYRNAATGEALLQLAWNKRETLLGGTKPGEPPPVNMQRSGKKAAGRTLGDRTWDQYPA